jgi:hypothetical protein
MCTRLLSIAAIPHTTGACPFLFPHKSSFSFSVHALTFLLQVHLRQMKDATLLYMFYNLHRDPVHQYRRIRTESLAAQELISRSWVYLRERNVWAIRRLGGEWVHFDHVAWETRLTPVEWIPAQYPGAPGNVAMGAGSI